MILNYKPNKNSKVIVGKAQLDFGALFSQRTFIHISTRAFDELILGSAERLCLLDRELDQDASLPTAPVTEHHWSLSRYRVAHLKKYYSLFLGNCWKDSLIKEIPIEHIKFMFRLYHHGNPKCFRKVLVQNNSNFNFFNLSRDS